MNYPENANAKWTECRCLSPKWKMTVRICRPRLDLDACQADSESESESVSAAEAEAEAEAEAIRCS